MEHSKLLCQELILEIRMVGTIWRYTLVHLWLHPNAYSSDQLMGERALGSSHAVSFVENYLPIQHFSISASRVGTTSQHHLDRKAYSLEFCRRHTMTEPSHRLDANSMSVFLAGTRVHSVLWQTFGVLSLILCHRSAQWRRMSGVSLAPAPSTTYQRVILNNAGEGGGVKLCSLCRPSTFQRLPTPLVVWWCFTKWQGTGCDNSSWYC